MKITNKYGVPQTLVNLMERDTYSRGSCHISVTQLIDAPRIKILKEKHADDMVQDVSESLWSMVGRAMHLVAEGGADDEHLAEERLFAKVLGWDLSGGIDLQKIGEVVKIMDYKFTSVWAALQNKPEWERQLNTYSWLARVNKGWATNGLEICALLRDWNRRDAQRGNGYPPAPIMTVPVKLWSFEEQQAYVEERIKLHQEAWRAEEWGDTLPLCSAEERWAKPDKWALKKQDAKRATALFEDPEAAKAELLKRGGGYYLEKRNGEQTRCLAFCQAMQWCEQFKAFNQSPLDDL